MRRRAVQAIVLAGALAMGVPLGEAAAKGAPSAEGLAQCKKTYQSGAGNTFFKWCFHANGTLGYLEAPVNERQIYGDNFFVCSSNNATVHGQAFSNPTGFSTGGFNPPTFPTLNSVVMRTSDGRFEIKSVFNQDAAAKSIFVDVTVKNLLGSAIPSVTFSRVIDFDLNNSPSSDLWIRSYASVLAAEKNAVSMTGTSWTYGRLSQIEPFHAVTDCLDAAAPSPSTGDYMGRVNYLLGNMAGGSSKTFRYRIAQL